MTPDTVANDLIRHLIAVDHAEAEAAEVERRTMEYLGTLHGRNTLIGDAEVDEKLCALFGCVCTSRFAPNITVAIEELYAAAVQAATRHAVDDLREERNEAQAEARERMEEAREYERMAALSPVRWNDGLGNDFRRTA